MIDAVRCAKLGLVRGLAGPPEAPSAWYMKSPPRQMRDDAALRALGFFLDSDGRSSTPAWDSESGAGADKSGEKGRRRIGGAV